MNKQDAMMTMVELKVMKRKIREKKKERKKKIEIWLIHVYISYAPIVCFKYNVTTYLYNYILQSNMPQNDFDKNYAIVYKTSAIYIDKRLIVLHK